jgi:hypothetical protein
VKGYADRLLVYITLYISACLGKLPHKSKGEADKVLYSFAIENFAMPGDKTFALGGLCVAPANRGDAETLKVNKSIPSIPPISHRTRRQPSLPSIPPAKLVVFFCARNGSAASLSAHKTQLPLFDLFFLHVLFRVLTFSLSLSLSLFL